ncbi:DICT sensory domain-containing protein [Halobellus marinus]|uniref:DICT sensory domain-containing protein n=1 Tax=Halobellus TaxID=1073986 RepID=UPI0028B07404|nr:DICT sensory domain-containing protein [Halobellus sp. DFY28]
MKLREFVDEFSEAGHDTSLSVVNSSQPPTVSRMLDRLFTEQSIGVSEVTRALSAADVVRLRRDGEVVAESDFEDVRDAILAVNSDIYVTGSRSLADVETPDVVSSLEGLRFRVRGYPEGSKGKLLLIEISRYIEAMALRHERGELHTGFQRLSRIADERGTRHAYEELAATDLDVHVYGIGDASPLDSQSVTLHADDAEEIRNGWFVVFAPPAGEDVAGAVLVAVTDDDTEWEGVWTADTDAARRVAVYLEDTYGG